MITVSSTKFQNNAGYYLEQLFEGKHIRIVKEKPEKKEMTLISKDVILSTKKARHQKLLELINKYKHYKPKYFKSGRELKQFMRKDD
ncbi:MAG: hypothetical protein QY314_02845 [Candidatus Dojkabacteria bacterium]|nr:MAG: hypothetical protein QY314_02845 [Candidatus Dojkabacteria bacterium]